MKLMKKLLIIIIPLCIILALTLANYFRSEPIVAKAVEHGLPWQVEIIDNKPKVFHLTVGESTLGDAVTLIGDDHELAIMSKDDSAALEVYFPLFTTGPITGKLVLVADIADTDLRHLIDNVPNYKMLETGVKKMDVEFSQQAEALNYPIKSITFAPVAQLTRGLVIQHFGKPSSLEKISESEVHVFYQNLGLRIIVNNDGKDFIEYSMDFTLDK